MGRIVKMNGDGTVVSADWVTGLNAPKGIRTHDGTLWVSDIDTLISVDVNTGQVKSRVQIPNAKFLNDVAVGDDGTVYVTDTMGNQIFAVKDGQATTVAQGDQLEAPNGILVEGNRLIVGGVGSGLKPDFSTTTPGHLYALDLTSKEKTLITKEPVGLIDGVESDGHGGYVISENPTGRILHVAADGSTQLLKQVMPSAADIGIAPDGVVLVPQMQQNQIVAIDVADALK
jgi:sugar lactone lactonase YvrE